MNKLLFTTIIGSTALAGAALANLELGVSGYYKNGVIIVADDTVGSADSDHQDVQSGQDYEIKFGGKFEMDNGITVFGGIEMDSAFDNNNVQYDDIEFGFSGSFGKVMLGNFAQGHMYKMPTVTTNEYDPLDGFQDGVDMNRTGLDGDGTSIGYGTPNIGGFTAGGRFMFNGERGQTNSNTVTKDEIQGVEVGAGYSGSFGDTSFAVGGAYLAEISGAAGAQQKSEYTVGASVGMSGFVLKGQFSAFDDGTPTNSESNSYGLDLGYKTGPWAFTAAYGYEENEAATTDTEITNYVLKSSYAFGPGVKLFAEASMGDTDANGTANDEETTIVYIGTQINF